MKTLYKNLHERALACARRYRRAEAELLELIGQIDKTKTFRKLGYGSLFDYATSALKLSSGQAFNFINVSRKAHEVPQLKHAVASGKLSVSKARKIVPVLRPDNQAVWIEKAITLPQRQVEREVAEANPLLSVSERIRPVAKARSELKCGISTQLEEKIQKARDLISQKTRKACTLEEAFDVVFDEYLQRFDPLEKAKRIAKKKKSLPAKLPVARQVRGHRPARLTHQLHLRDRRQCRFKTPQGGRCESKRWLQIHHRVPVASGGSNTLENLITLCAAHHAHIHSGLLQNPSRTY